VPSSLVETTLENARENFQRDGYLVIRGFFNKRQTDGMLDNVKRYIREVVPTIEQEHVFMDETGNPDQIFRLEHMDMHDDWFDRLNHDDRITSLVRRLLMDEIVYQRVAMFGKLPNGGEATPPHQDGYYFKLTPNEAVTCWLPLDPVDTANGCIRYVPGSHRAPIRDHVAGKTFGFSLGIEDLTQEDLEREVAVEAGPGDLVLHHALTIHRADANNSDRQRRVIGLVYFAQRARVDTEAVKAHDEKIKKRWKKAGRI